LTISEIPVSLRNEFNRPLLTGRDHRKRVIRLAVGSIGSKKELLSVPSGTARCFQNICTGRQVELVLLSSTNKAAGDLAAAESFNFDKGVLSATLRLYGDAVTAAVI